MTHLNFRNTFGFGICAALLFALALLNPAVAQEDTSAQPDNETESMAQGLLDTIHRFRLRNFMALNHYYNYTTDPDEALASQINDEMDASQDLISRIQELAGESLTGTELDDLSQAYQNFSDQMDTNIEDMRSSGYPDLRLLSDMANQAQNLSVLSGKLYNRVAEQDQTPTAEKVELAREASVTMALMVTRYSARSSSSVAQVFQGADTEKSLDELARQFENNLEQLRKDANSDNQLDSMLSDVNSKWQFIRDSYINYDEENVSFVIDRYSTGIIETLEESIERLKAA
jgi:23S rRNA U2552 (ribose-2'-O)-methylase RlmE/FtsJ